MSISTGHGMIRSNGPCDAPSLGYWFPKVICVMDTAVRQCNGGGRQGLERVPIECSLIGTSYKGKGAQAYANG